MNIRRERFKRLYPKRLEKAIWSIRSIGKLSEKSNYIFEEEEVLKMISKLVSELKVTIAKFGIPEESSNPEINDEIYDRLKNEINSLENIFNKRNELVSLELENIKRNLRI
tara:strand:+ start:173 stop:505 length:333 start_codon:yes stop_codon:yes gene_type:complete